MYVKRIFSKKEFDEGGCFYETFLTVLFEKGENFQEKLNDYVRNNVTWEKKCPCHKCNYLFDCKMYVDVSVFTPWTPKKAIIGTMKEIRLSQIYDAVIDSLVTFYDNVNEYQNLMKYDNVKLPPYVGQFIEQSLTQGGVQLTLLYIEDDMLKNKLHNYCLQKILVFVNQTNLEEINEAREKILKNESEYEKF